MRRASSSSSCCCWYLSIKTFRVWLCECLWLASSSSSSSGCGGRLFPSSTSTPHFPLSQEDELGKTKWNIMYKAMAHHMPNPPFCSAPCPPLFLTGSETRPAPRSFSNRTRSAISLINPVGVALTNGPLLTSAPAAAEPPPRPPPPPPPPLTCHRFQSRWLKGRW